MAITEKKKFYYVLMQKKKLIVLNRQLPFFFNRKTALEQSKLHKVDMIKISGAKLEKLIIDSIDSKK